MRKNADRGVKKSDNFADVINGRPLSGILGSVGGSLGLFIGFSLIEFLLFFVRWACNMRD